MLGIFAAFTTVIAPTICRENSHNSLKTPREPQNFFFHVGFVVYSIASYN